MVPKFETWNSLYISAMLLEFYFLFFWFWVSVKLLFHSFRFRFHDFSECECVRVHVKPHMCLCVLKCDLGGNCFSACVSIFINVSIALFVCVMRTAFWVLSQKPVSLLLCIFHCPVCSFKYRLFSLFLCTFAILSIYFSVFGLQK